MLTPFSSEDLGRVFDARALTKGRTLVLLGTVGVTLQDLSIAVVVEHLGLRHTASITPSSLGHRVVFLNKCSCGQSACVHLAAGALAALDRYPALRKAVQRNFLDALANPPAEERQRLVFELSPGAPPHACFVSTFLIGERTGRLEVTTPSRILADRASSETIRIMARLLGGGGTGRTPVAPSAVPSVLRLLARLGKARWHATGKPLVPGVERDFQAPGAERASPADMPPNLPPNSAIILGEAGPWYVDGATGAVGRVRLLHPPTRQIQPVGVVCGGPVHRPLPPGARSQGPTVQHFVPARFTPGHPAPSFREPLIRRQGPPRHAPSRAGRCHRRRSRHPATPRHPGATSAPGRMPG